SDLTPLTKLTKLKQVTLTNNKIKKSEFGKLNSNIAVFGKDSQEVEETTDPEPKPEEQQETSTLKILNVNDKTEKTQQIYEKSYEYKDAPKLEQIKENLPKTVKAKLQSTQKTSNSLENLGYKEGVLRLLILDDNNKPVADNTELRLKPTVIFNPTITAKTKNGIVEFKDLVEKATYTLKHDVKEINEMLQFTVNGGKLKEDYSLNKAGEITKKTFDYGEEIETKYFVGRIIDPANPRLDPFEVKEDTTKPKEILENLEIEWDNSKPDYNQKEGTYIFEGKLKFDKNIENINDYKVIAKIIVNKEKQDEKYNDWSAVMPKHSLDINQDHIDSHKNELFNGENVVEDINLIKTVNTLYHREGDAT
ncbi:MAG: hypothetical protein E6677_08095, partial [Finegoldia magna]|nr:hypothetical protein [Finegoldia magna]